MGQLGQQGEIEMMHSNIAGAINAAHAGVEAAKREGARYAVECGRLLAQAKDTVPHGGWDAWLRLNTTVSPRTAQLYMRIARHVEGDPTKAQRVAGLSVREAAVEATGPKRATATRKPLSPQAEHDFSELKKVWDEAKDNPDWQEGAARELFRLGYVTKQQRNDIIRSVWAKHYAHLTDADRKEAAKRAAEMLVEKIPRETLLKLIPKLKNVPASDIAIAMGDVQEDRKRRAAKALS
ncbi:DUF3102 domain-containing protein [Methylobacterium sp. E-046]|uniref:DUF3102 domain-containing protein n=1 Tax=Methylobacterium sp. E-046 TaxID=2836576 RepID=UPI001FB938DA|nr:DUF3102 domain-containing protein [Methylobacterium sp. E-046]MCJ2099200.1 DUF3102 domain-containing protein [Methylobacterium sp. E-046]